MKPLYIRWHAARMAQYRALAPSGRFINDEWVQA
jgi:hypothetical protein